VLRYALAQKKARDQGKNNWRELPDDGSREAPGASMIHVSISMSVEIKKRLPLDGVRWLYLRTEAKSIKNGRLDFQVLVLDESMDLVAISHQVAQLASGLDKSERKTASL
jgi:hypothetical protein